MLRIISTWDGKTIGMGIGETGIDTVVGKGVGDVDWFVKDEWNAIGFDSIP